MHVKRFYLQGLVITLMLAGLNGLLLFGQFSGQAYAASAISPNGCVNETTPNYAKVTTFVNAYKSGKSGKFTAELHCGQVSTNTYYIFNLVTNNRKLTVTQSKYFNDEPPTVTHPSCKIIVNSGMNANLDCSNGNVFFNLYNLPN